MCLACSAPAAARDFGQHGTLWPVIEPDLLTQIEARLTQLEKSGETARLNEQLKQRTIARVNRPEPVAGITNAVIARSWDFDPTISADRDIADEKGRIIIAAGTRVNPLDTVRLRSSLVFLDGDDPAQIAWASQRYGRTPAKFILVRGAPLVLMKARQRRFFFDQGGTLVKHFG
ncbi:MAG: type-F conjugative transfer system protein TraW, partial [Erythrobacter sp.]|uniref:type-F conjugative transfer system protein TraW n=1 Tax=Erythrobacter sp. TaxID=1042 RepID=UPI0025CD0278